MPVFRLGCGERWQLPRDLVHWHYYTRFYSRDQAGWSLEVDAPGRVVDRGAFCSAVGSWHDVVIGGEELRLEGLEARLR